MTSVSRGISWKNWAIRAALLAFALSSLFFYNDFVEHTYAHFTGSLINSVATGQWYLVALNIIIFVSFLVPLSFRRKVDWKEYGLVVAFFVSLFVEMYGIPLSIMFASRLIGPPLVDNLHYVLFVPVLGVTLAFTIQMMYGTMLMIIGTVFVTVGWVTLYRNIKKEKLVRTGIYSISRNPQYLGFILVIIGWLVGWPTLLTVIFAPILIFVYVRLCRVEEKEISHLHGFKRYRREVPWLI
jgi:protein-S-isoprenylcysteine O-methyltransferase Ste14